MAFNRDFGDNSDFGSIARSKTIKILLSLMALIFIGRLAQLQIIKGSEYKTVSETQAIKKVRVTPFRGNLFDRNQTLLVHNEPSFAITLTPYDFKPYSMNLLSSLLGIDSLEILRIIKAYQAFSKFTPIKIVRDADFEVVSKISEFLDYLPGIEVEVDSKRLYKFNCNMAHLIGYTREITREQLEKRKFYYPGDMIGQTGIEQSYESDLRGKNGIQYVAVNKFGQKVASFDNGGKDSKAINGFDLHLGLDIKLQELAEKLLDNRCGAVVGLDPNTGDVLVLASKPDYDPRAFTGKIPAELYKELSTDPRSPLLNRSIMSQYPPGSTWKMLMAMGALQEGIINDKTTLNCTGGLDYGGRYRKCHGGPHGNINVRQAIHVSCNTFFYQVGLKLGLEKFEYYGKLFGFGSKTGIDIPNEQSGRLPTRDWLISKLGKESESYIEGRMVNYGIGQGEILCTPLQIAIYTAAIANEGTLIQPHVISSIKNNFTNKDEKISYETKPIPINPEIFKIIKDGMYAVVNVPGGTASAAKLTDIEVCGKTGTAQNPHGQDHAWFTCFAPRENPKIVLCVFVENAGFGGGVSAPIAHEILNAFFHPELLNQQNQIVNKINSLDKTIQANTDTTKKEIIEN